MRRTPAPLGAREKGPGPRNELALASTPDWAPWLALLEIAMSAAEDPFWAAVPLARAPRPRVAAPLLHEATVQLDGRPARRLVRALLKAAAPAATPSAASLGRLRSRRLDPLALIEAAMRQDDTAAAGAADEVGVDPDALRVVAQLAAMPLLHACARRLAPDVTAHWPHGYCPVCGAWASLAELRGLERERRLRCGRCAADWRMSVLRCPFCDEKDHKQLGELLPEGEQQTRRVDVCRSCKGYIKTLTTLRATAGRSLALEDLETVPLDLTAQARGYSRPLGPGHPVRVSVVPAGSRFGRMAERWA